MQNAKGNEAKVGSRAERRRVALGIKIALGQVGDEGCLISEDDAAQALFDLGFEIGYSSLTRDIVTLQQGILGGMEQAMHDEAVNDNQGSLDLGD